MNKIIDEDYYDLIFNILLGELDNADNTNGNITYLNERHMLIHTKRNEEDICELGQTPYHRFPSLFTLTSTISMEKSGIGEVQRNNYLSLYGQGVLIGLIDTGIDYLNPVFRKKDNTTKINCIWDQTIESDNKPKDFSYGTEYNKVQINMALQSNSPLEEVPTIDDNGHGTAIASIIVGNEDSENDFSGVVPDAEIAVVKLKKAKKNLYDIFLVPEDKLCFQDSDVILAIRYLVTKAKELQRPLAICLAIGTSQGGHDGLGATSSYINYLSQISKIGIVVAAGNEGNKRRHFYSNIPRNGNLENIEINIGEDDKEFSLEVWMNVPARCTVELITPTGETTKMVYPSISSCQKYNFVFNQSTVWINNSLFEQETGDQLILIRFRNAISGIWNLKLVNLDQKPFELHAWLPNGDLISDSTFFIRANPYTTITSPGNARIPLTVSSYNPINDSFYIESSRGYNRAGIIKPDLAAPGVDIPCALLNNKFGTISGTGAAAAHTTGIMAMILEWADVRGNYTSITGNDINRLLIRGANREESIIYPNEEWGYGKIDVNRFFENLGLF